MTEHTELIDKAVGALPMSISSYAMTEFLYRTETEAVALERRSRSRIVEVVTIL